MGKPGVDRMSLQSGYKVFPHLGPKLRVCKQCAIYNKLDFEYQAYWDADVKKPWYCEVCGKFKPLFTCRNKHRRRIPKNWEDNK